ncbi:D-ribose pyranase [Actinocatenispora thailandica]|uniref:D-ribose pyranase n=1 Tax=Actinocatenispora thailandica TaxID=227318 RepID=A0A7R7DMC4_9ACTN|nr:D-ribose pyranase [Actinocatenispora thailandica]BCJ34211.1 D-ribose pyranase [Actinocatenispora thailandica]
MRRSGLWHPRLAALAAGLGHGDLLVVADAGLPVPRGVEVVDLAVARGEPGLLTVLRPILAELVVEHATLATELTDAKLIDEIIGQLGDIAVTWTSHEELKAHTAGAAAVVRTGEDTPFSNIVLRAGVAF